MFVGLLAAHLVFHRHDRVHLGQPVEDIGREATDVEPSQIGVLDDEEDDGQVGCLADVDGVVLDFLRGRRIEAVGVPEQHPVDPDGAGVVGHRDDVGRRVEDPLEQEPMPAIAASSTAISMNRRISSRVVAASETRRAPQNPNSMFRRTSCRMAASLSAFRSEV